MKKILIIGAGFLQAYVIKKCRELGYYTYVVDKNPNAEAFKFANEHKAIDIVDKEACLEYAKQKQIEGVLSPATDYGVLTASYISEKMSLPGMNYSVASVIKNKYQTRKALFEARADDTEQAYEITSKNDIEKISDVLCLPVMVKPCDGSGSRGASKVEKIEDFENACIQAMESSITKKALVESFINGKEYGVESFVYNGNVTVMGIMQKWMTSPPYYAELGHSIPSMLDDNTEKKIKECVTKALKALNVNFGAVNMDLLVTPEKSVHIVDVGARMGGNLIGSHIVPIGTGVDYMKAMIRGAVGDEIDLSSESAPRCVVTRLLALTPGVIKILSDFKAIEDKYNVQIHHHLSVGDKINEYHNNLDGCGYVVAISDDYDIALSNAEKALAEVNSTIVRE